MTGRILITGGGGFIGAHLANELIAAGRDVRVLDNLTPQVHGTKPQRPAYLHEDAEFVEGDVGDPRAVQRALADVDAVYHFAAAVGVGQSMWQVAHYTRVNALGTAVLLEALAENPVDRLVVASSMSVYGEGLYEDASGSFVEDATRSKEQLKHQEWEPRDARGVPLTPVPTPEWKRPELASVYALGKFDQERLSLLMGDALEIPTVALRFFNVYGPHQALSNPYTGVLAIFASRILNGKPPLVFEDGGQTRDFVSVHDVVQACRLALDARNAAGEVLNVGSGAARSVKSVADDLLAVLDRKDLEPEIPGQSRLGDIRHCYADITRARSVLGYEPRVRFQDGLRELSDWLADADAEDRFDEMRGELEKRRLVA